MSAPGAGRLGALAAGFAVLFVGTGVNFAFGILFKPILGELGSTARRSRWPPPRASS